MKKVLISDNISSKCVEILKEAGLEVDIKTGLKPEELKAIIGEYSGLVIRSATKVTAELIDAASQLKVVGRAGSGLDNVDKVAASKKGIVVMNTPGGNTVTTAEHALALMFAAARKIPQANASMAAGKWEKKKFMGIELFNKTLGIIGLGKIGSEVAKRAQGLGMHVIAYDPFLTPERALDLGVEKVELDALLARADIITLHAPMTPQTKNILSVENLAKSKKGVRIINCARGGLVDEAALRALLESGHVAGAAFDVFMNEPATENPLFGHPNVVCTPHLGASTSEAQENVALQVAEQMSDYLIRGAISNAVNFPSITAEEAPKLKPFIALAERLGSFAGQLVDSAIKKVTITYEGHVATLKTKALTASAIAGLLRPLLEGVNVVSAPAVAKERGVAVDEVTRAAEGDYESLITLSVETEAHERSVSGTVFHDGKPRIISINKIEVDALVAPTMIYVSNEDRPGFIGRFASILGNAKVNIATFALGRDREGGSAVALVEVDGVLLDTILAEVKTLPGVKEVKALAF